jgi:hypothetical protein
MRPTKSPEEIVREVAKRIKQDAPHADPIVVEALMSRLRAKLRRLQLEDHPK